MELLKLKKSNCKNCYKCIRHCPVKSIRFSGNQANIIGEECIYCGQCFVVCPQNAKIVSDSVEATKVLLAGDAPVIASVAPSFIANYGGTGIHALRKALLALGFAAVEETAIGATLVKNQYQKLLEEKQLPLMITSCCPTVNLLVEKYYPAVVPYLAPVITPMHAHALALKKEHPGCKVVFIGPCISKKYEGAHTDGAVDQVLLFEELTDWLAKKEIPLASIQDSEHYSRARFFPTAGGIIKSMNWPQDNYGYHVLTVDGVEQCIAALEDIQADNLSHCFIEMSACAGSCIGGPAIQKLHQSPVRDYAQVAGYAGTEDFPTSPTLPQELAHTYVHTPIKNTIPDEKRIQQILAQIGKTKPEHELNCGSCGYPTCRDKAIAVHQGKADFSMCLPYLTDKAESFSDNIIRNTPNSIIVLNHDLDIQQINSAACKLFSLTSDKDVLGEPVTRLLDPVAFVLAEEDPRQVHKEQVYLPDYQRYVEKTILYEKEYQIYICIMSDITTEMHEAKRKEAMSRQTVDTADKVIEKQMRIVQEIAFLLGETTAETKVALTKLKEYIADE